MKKVFILLALSAVVASAGTVLAQEQQAAVAVAETAPAPAPVPAAEPAPAVSANEEMQVSENLVFSSGEVLSVSEAAKTLTVKVYGESDTPATEKTVTVSVDGNTDITDGEKDRDLKSLVPQTEIDVEYDPATNKATYIFVY